MADDTKSGATQDADDSQADDQTTTDQQQQDDDLDKVDGLGDAGKEAIRKERDAARKAEEARKATDKELKAALKRLKDLEDRDLSETAKVAKERDDLAAKVQALTDKTRDLNGRDAIRSRALTMGANPKKLDLIVDALWRRLEFDDDDEPTNADKLLGGLKTQHGDLFVATLGKGDGGAGGGSKPKDDQNAALRRAFGRAG